MECNLYCVSNFNVFCWNCFWSSV